MRCVRCDEGNMRMYQVTHGGWTAEVCKHDSSFGCGFVVRRHNGAAIECFISGAKFDIKEGFLMTGRKESLMTEVLKRVSEAMGFEFDESLPLNCLHKDCWTEKLWRNAAELGSEKGWF